MKVNYSVRKSPNIELQLDKILCRTLGYCPSTNSCMYTWFLPTRLKIYNNKYNGIIKM